MSLYVCDFHQITFDSEHENGTECPICKIEKEVESKNEEIEELEDEKKELESQVESLEKELEDLKNK
jgi:septal ring factor EnvC (AmiA/AmiB activator)